MRNILHLLRKTFFNRFDAPNSTSMFLSATVSV